MIGPEPLETLTFHQLLEEALEHATWVVGYGDRPELVINELKRRLEPKEEEM